MNASDSTRKAQFNVHVKCDRGFGRKASAAILPILPRYEQDGELHPRISATVTPEAAALGRPRLKGQDADYRYHAPADPHHGIAVGDIAHSDLGVATASSIVGSVLDGTYKDVHSVLLYQHGKLVLEEYFYGYSAERKHQLRSATKSIVNSLAGIAIWVRTSLAEHSHVDNVSYGYFWWRPWLNLEPPTGSEHWKHAGVNATPTAWGYYSSRRRACLRTNSGRAGSGA